MLNLHIADPGELIFVVAERSVSIAAALPKEINPNKQINQLVRST